MRLIDACELNEIIDGNENLLRWQKEEMKLCVDACDTVYDVDAVASQVQRIINGDYEFLCPTDKVETMCKEYVECSDCFKEWIMRIVRNGGVK